MQGEMNDVVFCADLFVDLLETSSPDSPQPHASGQLHPAASVGGETE